eukprot:GHVS01087215.1.p1 GENE.GHVS01087215.1~~GHVS01087215.1.p1  ORF type:complete len:291 (+),score=36.07 GHVS01087215.1:90-962(+)
MCLWPMLWFVLGMRLCVVGLTGGIGTGKSTLSSWIGQNYHVHLIDADMISREVLLPGRAAYRALVRRFGSSILLPSDSAALSQSSAGIDRRMLGAVAFSSDVNRRTLNRITHFYILVEILKQIVSIRLNPVRCYHSWKTRWTHMGKKGFGKVANSGSRIESHNNVTTGSTSCSNSGTTGISGGLDGVLLDAPLLIETRLHWMCSPVLSVIVGNTDEQVQRVVRREEGKKATRGEQPISEEQVRRIVSAQVDDVQRMAQSDEIIVNNAQKEDMFKQAEVVIQRLLIKRRND